MTDKKQIAIDFAESISQSEIEKVILFGSALRNEIQKRVRHGYFSNS